MKRIVVGIDGSAASLAALRWAADEARAHRVPILVVNAWTFPIFTALPSTVPPPTSKQLAHEAAAIVHEAIHMVGDDLAGLQVEPLILEGDPATAIPHAVEETDLLVLGARGLGSLRRMLLGSVSRQCVEHAPCPVVVVHAHADAA